ncbi:MAG: DMT family transporter [Salinarimonas sp.]
MSGDATRLDARPGDPRDSRARWTGIACGLAAALIWGAFPVMTRLGLTRSGLDGADITFIRYTVSGLILAPWLLRRGLGGVGWGAIAAMVVGIGAPYMLVVSVGLAQAPVEQFAVATPASMIVFASLITFAVTGARPSRRVAFGIAVIVVGILIAGSDDIRAARTPPATWAIFLVGGLLWAIYTVTSKRCGVSALHATALVSVVSMVAYGPYYLATEGTRLFTLPPAVLATQALYQGVLVSIFALFFYSKAVVLLGAAVGATFAALVPASAIVLAALLLGEPPGATAAAGLVIVTLGMATTLRQAPPRHEATIGGADPDRSPTRRSADDGQ